MSLDSKKRCDLCASEVSKVYIAINGLQKQIYLHLECEEKVKGLKLVYLRRLRRHSKSSKAKDYSVSDEFTLCPSLETEE